MSIVQGTLRFAVTAWLALGLIACNRNDPPANTDTQSSVNTTDPAWISQKPDGARIAVVFVHGIFGDTLGAWRSDKDKSLFQFLKDAPGVGEKIHTFAFGFTSSMLKGDLAGSLDIREAANKLHESLRYFRVFEYDAVVFAAHSMGGLVVMRELANHPELVPKVPVLALYATPQEGAQIARVAEVFLKNPALRQLVPANSNDFLQQLSDDWARLPRKPHVVCGYEKSPTYGTMIVEWSSSTRFCSEPGIAIGGASHISLVKPDRPTHEAVVLLVNALNEHVVGRVFGAKLETPDFVTQGEHLVYELRSIESSVRLVNVGRHSLKVSVGELSNRKLFLTPRDMPIEVPADQTRNLGINLLLGATADSYDFVLNTNEPARKKVIVRVPDMTALVAQTARLRDTLTKEFSGFLLDPKNAYIGQLPPADEKATSELSSIAVAVLKREFPQASSEVLSLHTAGVLAPSMPQVAAAVLRQAEGRSESIARMPAAQALAGQLAASLGTKQVFANSPAEYTDPAPLRFPVWTTTEQIDNAATLARQMKAFNAFRPYGFSLEGDVLYAKGDKEGAARAYSASAMLHPTPTVDLRMKAARLPVSNLGLPRNAPSASEARPEAPR